ncbi:hypothetical protein CHARACLAT_000833, partial [Characodon lateralis]|nr:hypothetical protein [Characodon lateralis]
KQKLYISRILRAPRRLTGVTYDCLQHSCVLTQDTALHRVDMHPSPPPRLYASSISSCSKAACDVK